MKIGNKKNILKKLLMVILGLFVLVSVIIGIKKIPFKQIDKNTWIAFGGDLLGAVISGLVTFVALKITIDNEKNKGIEDRRMSILPYLSYYIVDDNYIEENKVEKRLVAPVAIIPKSSKNEKELRMGRFNLIIENLGLGIAIEPRLYKVYYDGQKSVHFTRNNTIINIGEKCVISLDAILPDKEVSIIILTIEYFNLIRDYYEQEVVINFQGRTVSYKDTSGESKSYTTDYKAVISQIKKPKVIENPKDK